MACSACGRDIKIVARGWCRACYARWYARGTTDYAPKPSKVACSVGGCVSLAVAKGMCDKHYRRVKDYGTPEGNPDRGNRSTHPLYGVWKHFRRFSGRTKVCQDWKDDFWKFVFDVGEKPSSKHRLYQADESRPLGPDNFVWKKSLVHKVDGEDEKTYRARVQRVYRKARKEAFDEYGLKRNYGLSNRLLGEMLDKQNHKCAICEKHEDTEINGKQIRLSVDHCHASGGVRGLLCSACNRGLGFFKDSPEILRKAADYLESN